MSFFKSIKNAFGSDNDDYDVYGQPTTFVNPFSKDKQLSEHDNQADDVQIVLDKKEEYSVDAEFADKAARLMNEHTHAVIDMLKGNWKKEREELLATVEEAKKTVEDSKEKMQANEANRRQAVTRANDLASKVAELEAANEKLDIEKKSLENRIKAMEVRDDGTAELNKEIDQLNAQVEELQKTAAERDAEIERLNGLVSTQSEGPSVEELAEQLQQRDDLIKQLKDNANDLEQRLDAANEDLKAAEELQTKLQEVEEFMEKKNAEIASLKQQVNDAAKTASQFDELRKKHIILTDENENLRKNIEQLEASAKQIADVQNRRSIETGNIIDSLKAQLATANATAEDFKRRYNALSADGNEKAANFAKITAERDDAKAELKRTQVTLQKKQHEAQAMIDAISNKDQRIAVLTQQLEQLSQELAQAKQNAEAANQEKLATFQDDPAMRAIEDIDWDDDGSLPPHPGEDPKQLSLF